jgi:hypothetical protein
VLAHRRQLVGGPDRDSGHAEPGRLLGQPGVAESVAVALDDRDDVGGRVDDGAQVCAPAVLVDVEGEAHLRSM